MAAALALLGLDGTASAEGGDGWTTSETGNEAFAALALPPVAVPGVRVGVVALADMVAAAQNPPASLQFGNSGGFTSPGNVIAPLDLPVGARLIRVDVFTRTATSLAVDVRLNVSLVGSTNTLVAPVTVAATIGTGQASYLPATPRTVALGERFYVEAACESLNRVFLGAIYQYFDANPQLNLLPTPIRVYDSRAGANPATVVKGALANNATRVIDCTLGGAVPPGAAAAMITLTLTGTGAGGYMALWRNGLADPGTSSINWDHTGTSVAVTTVVALDEAARLTAKAGPNASTNFIIDVIGFYA